MNWNKQKNTLLNDSMIRPGIYRRKIKVLGDGFPKFKCLKLENVTYIVKIAFPDTGFLEKAVPGEAIFDL